MLAKIYVKIVFPLYSFLTKKKSTICSLDNFVTLIYNSTTFANQTLTIRACTGFDGGFEVEEAIRGTGPRNNPYFKIKRKRKVSIRCLVAAVGLKSLTA